MTIDATTATGSQSGTGQAAVPAPAILDALGAGVLVVDAGGMVRYRNALAGEWLPDGEDLQSALAEARLLDPIEDWPTELARIVKAGQRSRFVGALQLPGQSTPRLVSFHCSPLGVSQLPPAGGVAILLVEEVGQEAIEQRLEVSARLASLGKLATRVAHELSNPLDGILRYTNLAMRLVGDTPGSKLKSYLAESRTGLLRMVQIIGDLLEYSRTTDGGFDAVNITEVVEQAMRSIAASADANGVIVTADFQTQAMPSICGTRLFQVCCNLMKNAVDAMPDGGRLSITVGRLDDEVVIRVADTGVGLPVPTEKVFEPFFTTKEPGKGTGLGLAICKDFVEGLQGTITAEPGEEGGAVFIVRIPSANCLPPRMPGGSFTAASVD